MGRASSGTLSASHDLHNARLAGDPQARVGNMSSGTCMREEEANNARGPELDDQIVMKWRTVELGVVPNFARILLRWKKIHKRAVHYYSGGSPPQYSYRK